jgi:hypothetical protein
VAIPENWSMQYQIINGQVSNISDVRAICPHCRNASTFAIRSVTFFPNPQLTHVHLVLHCNYAACKKVVYVYTTARTNAGSQRPDDAFFMYPSAAIDPPHPSVPAEIADDWVEAQKALQASAPKAAAVMLRRVLYGVLINKGCKLKPLHEGLKDLIQNERLPAIFDQWLPAIKDDGHDGAHPDRALQVSVENVTETVEYTSELLRFLYIEPYEFQQRKSRNAASSS